jgi:hypothetical protein
MGLFNLFQLSGQVILDSAEALTGLGNVQNAATRTGEVFKKVGGGISAAGKSLSTFVTLPILGAMGASIKLASDMNETVSKTGVVFKKGTQEVLNWSDKTLKSIGLAKGTALDMAAVYGDMGTAMGLSGAEAQKMAMDLVNLTGDMASFKNMRPDEIHIALTGAYTGETEALKRLGIVMTVANLEAFALSTGIKKTYKEMTQSEKIQLRYNYIMKASKNSIGDFERTQASASNQMRIFTEGLKESGARMGTLVLPFFTKAVNTLNRLLDAFSKLSEPMQKVSIFLALLAAGVGPLLIVTGSLVGAIGSIITVVGVLSPHITGIIVGLSAIVGVVTLLTTGFVTMAAKTGLVQKAFNFIKVTIEALKNVMNLDYGKAMKLLQQNLGMSEKEAAKFVNKLIIVGEKINDLVGIFNNFKSILDVVKNIISNDYKANMDILTKKFGLTEKEAAKLINRFIEWKDKITDIYTTVKDKLIVAFEWMFNKFVEMKSIDTSFIVNMIKDIVTWISPMKDGFILLKQSVTPLMPIFKDFATIIGAIVVSAIGVFLGVLNGVVAAVPYAINVIAGLIGIVTSILSMLRGLVTFDADMFVNGMTKLWDNINSIWNNGFRVVFFGIKGFVTTVVKFFKGLYNTLVGNSIIPDLINGIIKWFGKLPGRVYSYISNLVSSAVSKFNSFKNSAISTISSFVNNAISKISSFVSNFVSKIAGLPGKAATQFNNLKSKASSIIGGIAKSAYTWGKNLIGSFIDGIVSKVGALKQTLQNTANKIKDFLGFSSPTKEGAGSTADRWAPNLMRMFIKGIIDNKSNLKNAMADISNVLAVGDMKNVSMAGINTGSFSSGSRLKEQIQLIINNPKFFNQQDIDKMMNPVVKRLQTTLGNKRG